MQRVAFNCPQCRGELVADASLAGAVVSCPHCRGAVIIPATSTIPVPETPQAGAPAEAALTLPQTAMPAAPAPAPASVIDESGRRMPPTLGKAGRTDAEGLAIPAGTHQGTNDLPILGPASDPNRRQRPGTLRKTLVRSEGTLYRDDSERTYITPTHNPRVGRERTNIAIFVFIAFLIIAVIVIVSLDSNLFMPAEALKAKEEATRQVDLQERISESHIDLRNESDVEKLAREEKLRHEAEVRRKAAER